MSTELTQELRAKSEYLADGIYIYEYSDDNALLFTSDGISILNEIYVDQAVGQVLMRKFISLYA